MEFKFDWKSFVYDLLLTFTIPSFFVGMVKHSSSQYQTWIIAAILSCSFQITGLFLVKYAYSLIHQAPKNFRDIFLSKMEDMKVQNAKLFIKLVLALGMVYTDIRLLSFIGAYVTVGCILKSIINPKIEKIAAGSGDKP